MNKISGLLNQIRNHIDPTTGEVILPEEFDDPDVRDAVVDLVFLSGLNPNIKKNPSGNKLNRPAKKIFEELRVWRLGVAQQIALPPYCIFTDAELMSIAEGDVIYKQDLFRIKGISFTRYNLYADDIYNILKPYIESDISYLINPVEEAPIKDDFFEISEEDSTQISGTPIHEEDNSTDELSEDEFIRLIRVKYNCQLYRSERCTEVRPNCLKCRDFAIIPEVLEEEKDNWPKIGYATWIKLFGN